MARPKSTIFTSPSREKDVAGLQIAMDDSPAVRGGEAVGDPSRDFKRGSPRQLPARNSTRQRLAVEKFHDGELNSIGASDVVQRDDVRMRKCGDRPCFALEARPCVRIDRQPLGHQFDRDVTVEPCVSGSIHFAHAAGAKRQQNLVRAEPGSDGKGHGRVRLSPSGGLELPAIGRVDAAPDSATKVRMIGPTPMTAPSCSSIGEVMPRQLTKVPLRLFRSSRTARLDEIAIRACRRDTDG